MSRLLVMKFGGTSLGSPARIRRAARRVRAQLRAGRRVVIVVSATGGTTDRIQLWLNAVTRTGARVSREHDRALASGEELAAALLAAALEALGIRAYSLRGGEAGLRADGDFGRGRLTALDPSSIHELLERGVVPIVAGFQAVGADGELVTIGRGGSDATAVFLAGRLQADACHIITDVEAVCDSDPRLHPDARPLPRLTHDALLRITEAGGEVVQCAAARFASEFRTPLYVYHFKAPFGTPRGTTIGAPVPVRSAS